MNTQLVIQICIVAVLIIGFIIWFAWQIKKKGLKEFVIDMIIKAEDIYKRGNGNEKMLYVIDKVKAVLATTTIGKIVAIFITEDDIKKFIQSIFDNLKKALEYTPSK